MGHSSMVWGAPMTGREDQLTSANLLSVNKTYLNCWVRMFMRRCSLRGHWGLPDPWGRVLCPMGKKTAWKTWKTREALRQHIKRAAYQAGFCWGQMMVCTPELPSPCDWGWVHNDSTGVYVGQPFKRQLRHAGNCLDVAVRKVLEEGASVWRPRSSAQLYATAVGSVRESWTGTAEMVYLNL